MKARTKIQHRVTELSEMLPRITQNQKEWAYKNCLPHRGFENKTSVFCLDCGETFPLDLVKRKKAICPHCLTKLIIEKTRKTTSEYTNYFAITHVVDEFQVVENFELNVKYKKGISAQYHLHAILEDWILPNEKVQKIGLLHHTSGGCDSWGGNWEIRDNGTSYWNNSKYNVYPRKYHPDSKFKKEFEKYGINHNISEITVLEAIVNVPKNPHLETLLKAKQYSLLGQLLSYRISSYWKEIKICLRNNYKVEDASIWFDYLELLKYFKKDTHNAKYVCPKNIKKEHDRLVKKKRAILMVQELEREKLEKEKRQQKLEKAVVQYIERNKKFFELEFKKGNISIQILKSIDEFKKEGDELKHCVFTNEYYLKEESLIFSAKVDGKRTETIEVKLPEFKIEQARGMNNDPTEYHDEIIKLVRKNINNIKKIVIQSAA